MSRFCNAYNLENGQCLTCLYGFTLSNGACLDPGCQSQTLDTCQACKSNFVLNSDNYCEYSDANCLNPGPTRCETCRPGFFITFEGFCPRLPSGCAAAHLQTYQCLECEGGFQIDDNGNCFVI